MQMDNKTAVLAMIAIVAIVLIVTFTHKPAQHTQVGEGYRSAAPVQQVQTQRQALQPNIQEKKGTHTSSHIASYQNFYEDFYDIAGNWDPTLLNQQPIWPNQPATQHGEVTDATY